MRNKFQEFGCLSFNKNTLFMINFEPLTQTLTGHQIFTCDFPVVNDTGAVALPARLAKYLQDLFEQKKIPGQIRIGLDLQFLDLKQMDFPDMPDDELQQIVRDEAIRESVFSFSDEPVAVAYKTTGVKKTETGIVHKEILAVTVPQILIDSLINTFNLTDLKLLSIQPNIEGLQYFFTKKINTDLPVMLLNVLPDQAEFYIWVNRQPKFWRYLAVGADAPERLSAEVSLSLEHFQRRATDDDNLKPQKIYWLGETICDLALRQTFQVDDLTAEPLPELTGLAIVGLEKAELCFVNSPVSAKAAVWPGLKKLWPYGLVILGGLNLWLGWQIYQQQLRMEKTRQAYRDLCRTQTAMAKQLNDLTLARRPAIATGATFNLYSLMVDIGRIVPPEMQLEKLAFDPASRRLILEGFCLQTDNLPRFLLDLKNMDGFQKLSVIDSRRQTRDLLEVFSFHLETELGDNR